jgi:hypothetical protein
MTQTTTTVQPQKAQILFWNAFVLLCGLLFVTAHAQPHGEFEGFMLGIRANAVKGDVVHLRQDGKFSLEAGLKLEEGDSIRSGSDGYAELLLQPGNYLRIGNDTEFQIFCDQHDRMRLKLKRGTISVEILARDSTSRFFYFADDINDLIRVITPNTVVFISHPGIFRINAVSNVQTDVVVREGEVVIAGRVVKKRHRAVVANGNVLTAEIDPKIEDKFDAWSRERAQQLIQANKLLKKESLWSNRPKNVEPSVQLSDDENRDNRGFVISAKPGAVNFVEAGVEFAHGDKDWQQLTDKSQLGDGDRLRTNANSFVELMLFPDMHLRLSGLSEIKFDQLSNESVSLKLVRGSAILDVARFDRKVVPQITVGGLSTSVVITDDGNYRIDGDAITIREGKVIFNERTVGGCHTIANGSISDCNKTQYDNFDFWSHHRGEGQMYNGRTVVSMVNYLARLRRLRFRNTGFWFQQPGQTSYTFVPFSSERFRSPYGGSYSTVLAPRRRFI